MMRVHWVGIEISFVDDEEVSDLRKRDKYTHSCSQRCDT